eukprot:2532259-Pyramimonas_sp.AAC.1
MEVFRRFLHRGDWLGPRTVKQRSVTKHNSVGRGPELRKSPHFAILAAFPQFLVAGAVISEGGERSNAAMP